MTECTTYDVPRDIDHSTIYSVRCIAQFNLRSIRRWETLGGPCQRYLTYRINHGGYTAAAAERPGGTPLCTEDVHRRVTECILCMEYRSTATYGVHHSGAIRYTVTRVSQFRPLVLSPSPTLNCLFFFLSPSYSPLPHSLHGRLSSGFKSGSLPRAVQPTLSVLRPRP